MINGFMDGLPLWGVLAFTLIAVLTVSEGGFMLGARRARRAEFESEGQISSLTGAHLGLLAFIMAFSFSLAADHAGNRKRLVLEEANAIESVYQTAGLMDGAATGAIQALLKDYTQLRMDVHEIIAKDGIPSFVEKSEQLHTRIREQLKKHLEGGEITEVDGQLVDVINTLVNVHNKRVVAGTRSRLPTIIWVSLYVLLLLSMLGMGYYSGMQGRRSPLANTALAVSFSVVMILIADLDRPREGLIKPDQSLMNELNRRLNAGK